MCWYVQLSCSQYTIDLTFLILVKTTESANTQESKIGLLKPEDENKPEYGGWTSENARQRLNRFCMAERISCDFQNYSEGPCHSKVFFIYKGAVIPFVILDVEIIS